MRRLYSRLYGGNLTDFNIRKIQMLMKRENTKKRENNYINVCYAENACWYVPAGWKPGK